MMYDWLNPNFMPSVIIYSLSFIALFIGSITDLKTREVPDWINYGLIISGLGLNLLFSVIYQSSISARSMELNGRVVQQYILSPDSFIMSSILGLVIFFGIAYFLFEMGQWGGGDSKMLIGLGAMIGINLGFLKSQFLVGFFINAMLAGAIYGIFWSAYLALRNGKKFSREFRKILSHKQAVKAKRLIFMAILILLFLVFFIDAKFRILALFPVLLIPVTFYLWVFVKAIEKSSMYKIVEPDKLTEGDWIVNEVHVNGKYVTGPKELGISKSQIRELIHFYKKGKVKKILIKEGIPFVPSFLIAFAVTFIFGNPLMWLF